MIGDMSPTSVGRFIATAVATGWLITSSVKQDVPDANDMRASGARPTAAEAMPPAQFTEKLRDRLSQTAVPERGRNPFAYGARHSAPRQADPTAVEPAGMTPPPVAVEPPQPVFKLSGIAASQQDGVTVLTAIVIDNGVMVFAKTGDKLSNGYAVVRVEEGSITLIDANGVTQTLRLP
jgi:hypothetical protein